MKILLYLASAALILVSTSVNATVWHPTSSDTDFIEFDFAGNPGAGLGISNNGGTLALFDDSDFGGDALVIGENGGQVVFTDNENGSWNAEVFDETNTSVGSITLSNNPNFVLGMDWGLGYIVESNSTIVSSPDTYLIVFDGLDGSGMSISGNTLSVDLAPIPVPATVWLFGSGLLGLIAVMRRRA